MQRGNVRSKNEGTEGLRENMVKLANELTNWVIGSVRTNRIGLVPDEKLWLVIMI